MGLDHLIPEDQIRMRSLLIWEREGRPEGCAKEHWLRAIAELSDELERAWLVALEERENMELAMPLPQVREAPQRLEAARCDREVLPKAA